MSLDLHGIKHADVDRIVENFILLNNTPLNIITGKSDIMRNYVTKVLDRNDMKYGIPYYNAGMIKVIG